MMLEALEADWSRAVRHAYSSSELLRGLQVSRVSVRLAPELRS